MKIPQNAGEILAKLQGVKKVNGVDGRLPLARP
jgi:hypothetical protein